ncbi:arginine--tRNA ligase [candidate division WOR-3 bacterium]|nr:arginine--tRNA ligase [candidate division WOR-3 bacterium]
MAVHKLESLKEIVAEKISNRTGLEKADILSNFSDPPDPSYGDLALKTFSFARKMKLPPQAIAQEIRQKMDSTREFQVSSSGPYLNIVLNPSFACRHSVETVLKAKNEWGKSDFGGGKTVVIDYSSPNIAKPFGVGHLRSTAIGASLYRILQAVGYNTVGINHIGDWGTQFGIILAGFEAENTVLEDLEPDAVKKAYEIYIKYSEVSEKDPVFREKAKEWFSKLENEDDTAVKFWKIIKNSSLEEFKRTYSKLRISFDYYIGESFYADKIQKTLDFFLEKKLSKKDQGATIIPLDEYDLPPVLLTKSDGSTLYSTRELASVFYRIEKFKPLKLIYVVGIPQELHFKQISAALQKAGSIEEGMIVHVMFGHIHGMSTRKGTIIFLEDLLDEATERALSKIKEGQRASDKEIDAEKLAFSIGAGAVIFNDLKNKRVRDIEFDWDRVLSFEGETGPYLQYAHARICSIIRKAGTSTPDPSHCDLLVTEEEKRLALSIDMFPEAVATAAREYEPSVISRYLLDLAQNFSSFYHSHKVLAAPDEKLKRARLSLIEACKTTLSRGLFMLGIDAVEVM